MPELPEVETIVRDLSAKLVGVKIKTFQLFYPRAINVSLSVWRRRVLGQKIVKVWRRGKHLVFDLASGDHVVTHLKMTGQLIWQKRQQVVVGGHPIVGAGQILPNKFSRASFGFSDGSQLFFNDVRKFGWLKLVSDRQLTEQFARLGLEPLAAGFSAKTLAEALRAKAKSRLKSALLDQTKVVGLGNIYVDESLYNSRLKPTRLVASLRPSEWQALATAIKKVLKSSIKHRGTSFSDYRDASGAKGNFINKLKVYGRAGQSCLSCGQAIKKTKLAGRGTHWCADCQK